MLHGGDIPTHIISSPYPGSSVVPNHCRATYDRRTLVGESKDSILEQIKEVIKEAKKIINKPEDADYPIWAAADRKNALSGGSGYLIKLKVPREKVILFDADKWNKILNLKYLPDNEKDLKDHKKMLNMYGIDSDSDIMLSPHYPKLKEKIKNSWQKLFEDDISNIEKIKAALWELRLEWVQDISEF